MLHFRKDFVVYQDINAAPTKVTDNGFQEKVTQQYTSIEMSLGFICKVVNVIFMLIMLILFFVQSIFNT